MQEYDPDDHVHRFPAALASHTSLNPYSDLTHEPTDPSHSYTLPPGVQYAALDIAPEDWEHESIWRQRWLRYEYERQLRNPGHLLQGLDIEYWEAWPEYPILTPRRQDFESYDDYVHAARDFVMEIHRLQMKADRARDRDYPGMRHYIDVLFREN